MATITDIAEHLSNHASRLANEIVTEIASRFKFEVPHSEIEQAKHIYENFFEFLGEFLPCNEERIPEELLSWSKENGEREASVNGQISVILSRYPDTRIVFTKKISSICMEYSLSPDEMVTIITRVNYFLDLSINETVYAFERHAEEMIKQARNEAQELSAPVVPIQDGIAILPLIGSIDYDRAAVIQEKVIPKITKLKVTCLILDFSGILTIDSFIAKYIFDIHNVLRLIGVSTIATGIRPDLAQIITKENLNLTAIKTYATVRQAIDSLTSKA
ncbi:STAS domain-containing protein [Peribacillus kribbensis]|uniref:STAS domain-containing protein n=1 Tax=Peribacillus kribbensis TaxID=356658 RepID=UPI0004207B4B|nr:STAS domain-containing protein [Peribacillus kribbensis]